MPSKFHPLLLAMLVVAAQPATAATARLESYSVSEQTLESVVEDIAVATRVPIVLSEPSGIKVRNWKASGSALEVVRQLSQNYALLYNFDGTQYELTASRSAVTTTVRVDGMNRDAAMRIANRLYPRSSPGSVRSVPGGSGDVIILRGSRRFTETVEQALKACGTNCGSIRVIRGLANQ